MEDMPVFTLFNDPSDAPPARCPSSGGSTSLFINDLEDDPFNFAFPSPLLLTSSAIKAPSTTRNEYMLQIRREMRYELFDDELIRCSLFFGGFPRAELELVAMHWQQEYFALRAHWGSICDKLRTHCREWIYRKMRSIHAVSDDPAARAVPAVPAVPAHLVITDLDVLIDKGVRARSLRAELTALRVKDGIEIPSILPPFKSVEQVAQRRGLKCTTSHKNNVVMDIYRNASPVIRRSASASPLLAPPLSPRFQTCSPSPMLSPSIPSPSWTVKDIEHRIQETERTMETHRRALEALAQMQNALVLAKERKNADAY